MSCCRLPLKSEEELGRLARGVRDSEEMVMRRPNWEVSERNLVNCETSSAEASQ